MDTSMPPPSETMLWLQRTSVLMLQQVRANRHAEEMQCHIVLIFMVPPRRQEQEKVLLGVLAVSVSEICSKHSPLHVVLAIRAAARNRLRWRRRWAG